MRHLGVEYVRSRTGDGDDGCGGGCADGRAMGGQRMSSCSMARMYRARRHARICSSAATFLLSWLMPAVYAHPRAEASTAMSMTCFSRDGKHSSSRMVGIFTHRRKLWNRTGGASERVQTVARVQQVVLCGDHPFVRHVPLRPTSSHLFRSLNSRRL